MLLDQGLRKKQEDQEAKTSLDQKRGRDDVSQSRMYLYISLQRTAMLSWPPMFVCLGRGFQLHKFIAG